VLGKVVNAPLDGRGGAVLEAVALGRWEIPVREHMAVVPSVAGAALAGEDRWRRFTLRTLPGGVPWMSVDQNPADVVTAASLDVEFYLPIGRLPGPPALRPRTFVLRAGGDLGWSAPTRWKPGLAAAAGLSWNPWREYQGTLFVQVATPPNIWDPSIAVLVSQRVW